MEQLDSGGIVHRAAGPVDGPVVLMLHGWPESSYVFRHALEAAAKEGWRALAPDLPGYGDSAPDPPGTWAHHVEQVERFADALDLTAVTLVAHDWGGLIGLRWACDHPGRVGALVITATGFFPDGRWHGLAEALRGPGGEAIVEGTDRAQFARMLEPACPGIEPRTLDEFAKCLEGEERRQGTLDLYRSGDFAELDPYAGRLAELALPTLVLWGADDPFAPVGGAHRFGREIPGARVEILDEVGHFLWEQAPRRTCAALTRFLRSLG